MRDTGDGTAYKVDGVRGGVYVGQAGEARGTKALKDEDGAAARSALDAYRAEVEQAQTTTLFAGSGGDGGAGAAAAAAPGALAAASASAADSEQTASNAREALRFFFSNDGALFRGFLLDEVVNAADALSRSALARLVATPVVGALGSLPVPGAVREINAQLYSSLAPPLTEKDEKVVASLQKLIAFFAGELDVEDGRAAGPPVGQLATLDPETVQRARAVLPVLRENRKEMQEFATQIVVRLAELQVSRGLRGFVPKLTGVVGDRLAAAG